MDLKKAEKLAIWEMKKHDLHDWSFKFNNRKNALGLCSYKNKTISLSVIHTKANDFDMVNNTILHEIAHALVGSRHGHGWVWKKKAREIGCNAERCTASKAKHEYKHIYKCNDCKIEVGTHRILKNVDRKYHTSCRKLGKKGNIEKIK